MDNNELTDEYGKIVIESVKYENSYNDDGSEDRNNTRREEYDMIECGDRFEIW